MYLLDLPSELLLRVIDFIPSILDKCHLTQTCRQFHHLLTTNANCWSHLDFSAFTCRLVTNSRVLAFLKCNNISLLPCSIASKNKEYMLVFTATTTNHAVTMLNLSGCSYLTEELILRLCQSLPNLQQLFLNGYKTNNSRQYDYMDDLCKNNLDILRDHVYSAPSLINLRSKLLEPSDRETRLNISFTQLSAILHHCLPQLKRLSLQYQDLSGSSLISLFEKDSRVASTISDLDISSCHIHQPALQSLLRYMGPQLKSLKLLNIELNNLTWLCLEQYCKNIDTLHLSCVEPVSIQVIRRVLMSLPLLGDLRVTNFKSSDLMNPIIQALNASRLKKLDLSPQLVIYPNPNYNQQWASSTSICQPQFKTATRNFILTDESVRFLQTFSELVELRLCYPLISAQQFTSLITALSSHLRVLELRLSNTVALPTDRDDPLSYLAGDSFLDGLKRCRKLEELCLYSVFMSKNEIQNLFLKSSVPLRSTLKYLIINDGGPFIHEQRTIQKITSSLTNLQIFCLGGPLLETIHYVTKKRTMKSDNVTRL